MTTSAIHGYSDRISVAPGERIRFMVSCEGAESYRADMVRLIHGDTNPAGPGFKSQPVETTANREYAARHQPIHAGSHVLVDDSAGRLALSGAFTLHAFIWPTTPTNSNQGLLTRWSADRQAGYALLLDAAHQQLGGPIVLIWDNLKGHTSWPMVRWCLEHGLRVTQPLTLMSRGLYNEPAGAFLPSILY